MTNTYASFKGKLKVGDRVRDIYGDVWKVNFTAAAGVDMTCESLVEGHVISKCIHWNNQGTIELLSPPAPAEKEEDWWKEWLSDGELPLHGHHGDRDDEAVSMLVAEAKRRGAEEAWKEAKKLVDACSEFTDGGAYVSYTQWDDASDKKLESLNKPVTPGEK